jgi:hypothetical protein
MVAGTAIIGAGALAFLFIAIRGHTNLSVWTFLRVSIMVVSGRRYPVRNYNVSNKTVWVVVNDIG